MCACERGSKSKERIGKSECVVRGGGGKGGGERERDWPQSCLLLMLLQPFDASPPIQSTEEEERLQQGGRGRERHLCEDAPVLASTHGKSKPPISIPASFSSPLPFASAPSLCVRVAFSPVESHL